MSRATATRHVVPVLVLFATLLLTGCLGDEEQSHHVDLNGRILYEDRLLGLLDPGTVNERVGFTTTKTRPVRHATVDLVSGGDVIATTSTDEDGHYALSGKTGGEARVRVVPKGTLPSAIDVRSAAGGELLAAAKTFDPAEGSLNLDMTVGADNPAGGAFNILDVFTFAAEFVDEVSGAYPPALTAYWNQGNTEGTYTEFSGPSIWVLGVEDGDADEFDDDVLWHEYGHFLEGAFDALSSRGGAHALWELDQDIRLAWSEGWSDFLPLAIKSWITEHPDYGPDILSQEADLPLGLYVDTAGGEAAIAYDFAAAPRLEFDDGSTFEPAYATNEGAVAKVLAELHDTYGLQSVWNTFEALGDESGTVASLESFWDIWRTRSEADPAADVTDILIPRGIEYRTDDAEPDDEPSQASAPTTDRNLYKTTGPDTDFIPLPVTDGNTYRIETHDLVNGADTSVRIVTEDGSQVYRADGTTPLANDNHLCPDGTELSYRTRSENTSLNNNDGCTLASRIEFDATAETTYYVEVTTSGERPFSAGSYGGYAVTLSENPSGSPRCTRSTDSEAPDYDPDCPAD